MAMIILKQRPAGAAQTFASFLDHRHSMERKSENKIQLTTAVLCVLFLCVYIAAKIDFVRRFSYFETGSYLREHSIYWLALALIALAVWLIESRKQT
jgi:uncharacterized membrane protein YidH (DUF202 family)